MPIVNDYNPPKRKQLTKAKRQAVYDKCGGHCAEIWVFGTYISAGMQDEILLAQQWEIPIKYFNFFNGIYIEVTR